MAAVCSQSVAFRLVARGVTSRRSARRLPRAAAASSAAGPGPMPFNFGGVSEKAPGVFGVEAPGVRPVPRPAPAPARHPAGPHT